MKSYVQIGIILVALIAALTFAMRSMSSGRANRDQGVGLITVRVVSAPDVLADYKAFGTSPDEGLKSQWFVIHGTVSEIQEVGGVKSVVFDTGDKRIGIACQLKNSADADKVKKGEEVGIAGRGAAGAMGNVPMLQCWVLSADQWQGKQKTEIDVGD
jgi:hypothetical protein